MSKTTTSSLKNNNQCEIPSVKALDLDFPLLFIIHSGRTNRSVSAHMAQWVRLE